MRRYAIRGYTSLALKTDALERLPGDLPPIEVETTSGPLRVKREAGEWHVAGKRRRFDAARRISETKWRTETDKELSWALARLNGRSAPNDVDCLTALYVLETKVPQVA